MDSTYTFPRAHTHTNYSNYNIAKYPASHLSTTYYITTPHVHYDYQTPLGEISTINFEKKCRSNSFKYVTKACQSPARVVD